MSDAIRLVPVLCAVCREKVLVSEATLEGPLPATCARCQETPEEEHARKAREVGGGKRRNPNRGNVTGG